MDVPGLQPAIDKNLIPQILEVKLSQNNFEILPI